MSAIEKSKRKYIDYEKQERECYGCLTILPFKKFHIGKDTGKPASNCKKCHSKTVSNRAQEKKIALFPDRYWQCINEACIKIQSISFAFCRHCGTKNA